VDLSVDHSAVIMFPSPMCLTSGTKATRMECIGVEDLSLKMNVDAWLDSCLVIENALYAEETYDPVISSSVKVRPSCVTGLSVGTGYLMSLPGSGVQILARPAVALTA